jgi:hypothetical protein
MVEVEGESEWLWKDLVSKGGKAIGEKIERPNSKG